MFQVPVVDIYVTGVCNLGCRYCFGENDSKGGMSRATFNKALEFAHHVGATTLASILYLQPLSESSL